MESWIRRFIAVVSAAVLAIIALMMVGTLLYGLFDPRVDNGEIFKLITPVFTLVIGVFATLLGSFRGKE